MTHQHREEEAMSGTILIFGQNIYGRGTTLDEAKRNYRHMGGLLNQQHTVVTFPSEATDIEVDGLGQVTWNGPEPTVEQKLFGQVRTSR